MGKEALKADSRNNKTVTKRIPFAATSDGKMRVKRATQAFLTLPHKSSAMSLHLLDCLKGMGLMMRPSHRPGAEGSA